MQIENEGLEAALREGKISDESYRIYQYYLRSLEQSISHHLVSSLRFLFLLVVRLMNALFFRILHIELPFRKKRRQKFSEYETELTEVYFSNTELILQALDNLREVYDDQLISYLQLDRLRTAKAIHLTGLRRRMTTSNLPELMRGYYLERKTIFEYETAGKITSDEAIKLRQNVNSLEDYSMQSHESKGFFAFLR